MAGVKVIAVDLTSERLEACRSHMFDSLRASRLMSSSPCERPAAVLERVTTTTSYTDLRFAAFVIENVTERWDIKKSVYGELDVHCGADCVIAANTSAIPITHIAAVTARPERIIGIHFMNPVPLKTTAEVIRGYHTSEATLLTALAWLQRLGKKAVVVGDGPGFVTNRVLMLTINEAIGVLHDRIAPAADVDRLFRECFGHPMGPLETADLIGLDTILDTLEVLLEFTHDAKFRPLPVLRKMVDAGLCGRKTGRGFYEYG
jgi:3-hydroxybutyryl-CoA dehydrogenase